MMKRIHASDLKTIQRCPTLSRLVREHGQETNDAADFGIQVHKAIEQAYNTKCMPHDIPPQVVPYVLAAEKYFPTSGLAEYAWRGEYKGLLFGGTIDLLARNFLLDWKTGRYKVDIESDIQAVLYSFFIQRPIRFIYLRDDTVQVRMAATGEDMDKYVMPYARAAHNLPVIQNRTACYQFRKPCQFVSECGRGAFDCLERKEFVPWEGI